MNAPDFRARLREVPHQPGVYLMKDRLGSIIYVGKARDLKKRMSSYFMASQKMRASLKTRALIDSIHDFEFHTVRNEEESLLLEGKLIKDYRPRYNVAFRDDKRFLLVKIRLADPWPRFATTRMKKDDGSRYFGPFPHSSALHQTLEWLNRGFGLRVCRPVQSGRRGLPPLQRRHHPELLGSMHRPDHPGGVFRTHRGSLPDPRRQGPA